jgi:propanol-preferring alcohol dehydrogenase
MKALALEAFDVPAAVIDVAAPAAGPGEVSVKVDAASVNAYDVSVAAGFMKDYMSYEFPAVIGSDVTGTIESVGDGVEGFANGDHVAVDPNILCGICDFCRRGAENLCDRAQFTGWDVNGGYAEYLKEVA